MRSNRFCIAVVCRAKVGAGSPSLPCPRSGFRKERIGSVRSHYLTVLAESTYVNVGGPYGEGSSPPMKRMGGGGPIGRAWQHASQAG
jgi:hypothetical protein